MSDVAAERRVLAGPEEVARAAATLFREAARAAIASRGRFTVALAGGSTPRRTYELLADDPGVDWSRTHVFWGDERCVPPADHASNYRMAAQALIGRVPLPPAQVHRIRAELGAAEGAAAYASELAAFFGAERPEEAGAAPTFDLVLLGLGDDGHTASLFPGDVALQATGWTAPARAPAGVPVAERITLTLPTIASASTVAFLVTGAGKADVVRRVLAGDRALPAARVAARERLVWVMDEAAAGGRTEAG